MLAVGGGSAIDTAKAPSAARGLPLVSVPTTYSGSEWTPTFGVREPDRKMVGGGGGANLAGIVYDPQLTVGLPRAESGGTAMNALAHTAEALYVQGRSDEGDERALAGARLIAELLAARARASRTTSSSGRTCSKALRTPARRSRSLGSGSATRWRRPSAGPTGSRTAR